MTCSKDRKWKSNRRKNKKKWMLFCLLNAVHKKNSILQNRKKTSLNRTCGKMELKAILLYLSVV